MVLTNTLVFLSKNIDIMVFIFAPAMKNYD